MSMVKSDVMKISTAHYFYAEDENLEAPTMADLGSISAIEALGYTHVGYTSSENALETEAEGGEVSYDGPLQNTSLFTTIESEIRSFTFNVWEWSSNNFRLAFGKNAVTRPDGSVGKHRFPQPMSGTWLVVFTTVEGYTYFHAPEADFIGTGDFGSVGGQNSYADMPIRVTPKFLDGADAAFYVLPLDKYREGDAP